MAEIISHAENGTGDANYVIIDVRGADEIMMGTGVMSNIVHVLPLPEISSVSALAHSALCVCFYLSLSLVDWLYTAALARVIPDGCL